MNFILLFTALLQHTQEGMTLFNNIVVKDLEDLLFHTRLVFLLRRLE
jgi:hypothetical protein